MAKGTLFEEYVTNAVLAHDWSTTKPGDKKEGTRHFSDFFQLFVLWRYGGVYFDADQVLLRDLYQLPVNEFNIRMNGEHAELHQTLWDIVLRD